MNATQPSGSSSLFAFDNSYARELEGFYASLAPAPSPSPRMLKLNRSLAGELGLDADELATERGLAILSGSAVPDGAQPLAQAYSGHQFGNYSPQLGDGRALLLGEVIDREGRRRDIAFKGSGRTPFSRGGDGKAAIGPVLREYLVGEAMHALRIPTTRALAAVGTGESVQRETPLPGAILTRVAASHVRVGTFQFVAARKDEAQLRRLADYVIRRHFPAIEGRDDRYLALLRAVSDRQAALIAAWMGVGFIHGVMNTDNMAIAGETIDYGPCAFMESYDPQAVFSSIDVQCRYAYGNQPLVAQWNLARFAETLLPLLDASSDLAVERATEVIDEFPENYRARWLSVLRHKLALAEGGPDEFDHELGNDFLALLHEHRADFTLGFRRLSAAARGDDAPLLTLFADKTEAVAAWLSRWRVRLDGADPGTTLDAANPVYIPRNHQVEAALAASVVHEDLAPFERLLSVLERPFDERIEDVEFTAPAPAEQTASYRTFCGT